MPARPVILGAGLLSLLGMLIMTALPARHRRELPENLVLGIIGGLFDWMLVLGAASIVFRLQRLDSAERTPAARVVILWLALLIGAVLGVAGTSALFRKSFLGLLAIVGWALPLPALLLAYGHVHERCRAATLWLGLPLLAVLVGVIALAPMGSRPASIQWEENRPDDIVLLTWNLGYGQPASYASAAEDLPAVAGVIRDQGVDVACLQEVGGAEHLEILLKELGAGWSGRLAVPEYRKTAIVSRRAGTYSVPRPELPYGGPTCFVLDDPRGALEFVSLHLPPEQLSAYREAYVAWLTTYVHGVGRPVVIAGDFNMDPEGWWDRLAPVFSDDVARDARTVGQLETLGRDVGRAGAATATFSRRLDRVFVPPTVTVVQYRILHGVRRGRMDHDPVLVRLRQTRARIITQ